MKELMANLGASLIAGQTEEIKGFAEEALRAGMSPHQIIEQGMMPSMAELGERFSQGEAYLPELLLAAHTMKAAMAILKGATSQQEMKPGATMLIGTVAGDVHDLGKNIVRMMFESAAFRVVDMGVNVSAEQFLEAYAREKPALVGLSSLLTTTMGEMKNIVERLRAAYPEAKLIVGGAPIRQDFADQIGAHGYAPDAHTAVKVGKEIAGL
jgi:5-methyltetrahydrofolate--homocysteine methyltransferase